MKVAVLPAAAFKMREENCNFHFKPSPNQCIIIFQVYINNKTQIDPVLDKVKAQLSEISGKVTAMIPQAKPAEKTE